MSTQLLEPDVSTAEGFNAKYPIGTPVKAWYGFKYGEPLITKTRSKAWDICGTPAVSVEGKAGGIALTHIQVITNETDITS